MDEMAGRAAIVTGGSAGIGRATALAFARRAASVLVADAIAERAEPMGRAGTPEEVAASLLRLCSQGASFVTGHPLAIDGGFVSR